MEDKWEEIGIQRPLAGFWYRYVLTIAEMFIGLFVSGLLLNVIYPYPESSGYISIVDGLFLLMKKVFDLGTNNMMERFIGENRVKDPKRMLSYIQYFIWYQMLTGLFQATIIAIYAFFMASTGNLAHVVWIMLIYTMTQYPGFLGVFRGALRGMQHIGKSEVLNFINGQMFKRLTEIGLILLGKWYGRTHPEVGELMGMAFGGAVGIYVNEFLTTALSAHFFKNVLNQQNMRLRDCFYPDFDWEIMKEALSFGIKTGIPSMVDSIAAVLILSFWIEYVPQYTTFLMLKRVAGEITEVLQQGQNIQITATISESYLNKKRKLTTYNISITMHFIIVIEGFLVVTLLFFLPLFEQAFVFLELENYMLSIPFLVPLMVATTMKAFYENSKRILKGMGDANTLVVIGIIEIIIKIAFNSIMLIGLELPRKYGFTAIIWLMSLQDFGSMLFTFIAVTIFINKKRVPLHFNGYASLGASFLAGLLSFVPCYLFRIYVFNPIAGLFEGGILIGVVLAFPFIFFVIPMLFYFPLTGYFGAWDEGSLELFDKIVDLSGPSRFFIEPLYKLMKKAKKRSFISKRNLFAHEQAQEEIEELMELKSQSQSSIKKTN